MKIDELTRYDVEDGIAIVTVDSPPVNALSAAVREGVRAAVEAALADGAARAVVLMCAGRTFFAGADITEFGKPRVNPTLPQLVAQLESASKAVIAAIHGTALGGGLELALGAHYRVAVPSAKFGLPEVKLGLLPGAGGTQRLPRLVGVQRALEMVTSGEHVRSPEAHAMGLVDELVEEGALRKGAVAFARRVVDERRPLRKVRDLEAALEPARVDPSMFEAFRAANARRFRGFLAPEHIIRCIEAAVRLPFEEGLRFERRMFEELLADSQSAAQRHVFFAERRAAKVPDVPPETPTVPITRVGVIGAGTMGGGIAMNFLSCGIPVTLVEITREALDRGIGVMRRNYENSARKGRMTREQLDSAMGLLNGSVDIGAVTDCDLIIEAAFEQMQIKKDIFRKLDAVARPGALLASNTSYLNLDEIAAVTSRPQDVIGLHFFSPANVMRLLEIVRGEKTSREAVATALKLARTIGKVGVVVGVCHGFVGNRMLAQRQREAEKLILEGAWPWDVDRVVRDFGFPMGPFQMRDLTGMDVGWDPSKSSSSTVREILNEMGRRGQKTSAGYYDYDEQRNATPSPVVEQVILDFCGRRGLERRPIEDREILERCLYPMVNEGANILLERRASRASDIDLIWVTGYGWPAYRGGPMFWAQLEGLERILARLRELHTRQGEDFRPSPLLERLVAEGRSFDDS